MAWVVLGLTIPSALPTISRIGTCTAGMEAVAEGLVSAAAMFTTTSTRVSRAAARMLGLHPSNDLPHRNAPHLPGQAATTQDRRWRSPRRSERSAGHRRSGYDSGTAPCPTRWRSRSSPKWPGVPTCSGSMNGWSRSHDRRRSRGRVLRWRHMECPGPSPSPGRTAAGESAAPRTRHGDLLPAGPEWPRRPVVGSPGYWSRPGGQPKKQDESEYHEPLNVEPHRYLLQPTIRR